jgi:hypothetical protein
METSGNSRDFSLAVNSEVQFGDATLRDYLRRFELGVSTTGFLFGYEAEATNEPGQRGGVKSPGLRCE